MEFCATDNNPINFCVARHVIWSIADQMHKGILMLTSVVFFSLYDWNTLVVWTVLTQRLQDSFHT
jgi:hypothetical protein